MSIIDETIIFTNIIKSGAGFGVVQSNGESCFVPKSVVHAMGLKLNSIYKVKLTPNNISNLSEPPRNVTKWMVVYVEPGQDVVDLPPPRQLEMVLPAPQPQEPPEPEPEEVATKVRETMKTGGVWSVGELFAHLYPQYSRSDNRRVYNSVSHAVRGMFEKDECAKWTFVSKASNTRVSKEWFSCFPENVQLVVDV